MKEKKILAALSASYAAAMLVLFPFVIHRYYDSSAVKFSTYFVFSLIYLFGGIFLAIKTFADGKRPARPSLRTTLLLLVAVGGCISTLASPAPISAFWGLDGYLGGACLLVLAVFGCWLISFALPISFLPTLAVLFVGGGVGVSALAVLNDFGVDPFMLYEYTNPAQYLQFFSTIGNVDYLNAFVCLWLPLACWNYISTPKHGKARFGWLAAAVVGFFGMAMLDTGLATIGVGAALLICLLCVPLAVWQYSPLFCLMAAWAGTQGLAARLSDTCQLQRAERIFSVFPAEAAITLAVLLLLGAFALRCKFPRGTDARVCLPLQRGLALAMLLLLAGGFYLGTTHRADLGVLKNFFCLDADWGSERGAIYADVLQIFAAAPPLRKLFGYGMGMISALMSWTDNLPYPMWNVFGAHSEYLDTLLATGAVGLISWLAAVGAYLVPALRTEQRTHNSAGWVLCAAAYSVQAAFNNRVVAVFPVFMALLGVVGAALRRTESPCESPHYLVHFAAAAVLLPGCAVLGYFLFQTMLF